jgi:hypothetical protein
MEPQGLWERAERLRSAADEAARLAQNIYLSFLLLGTYIAIIIGSTTDVQLLKVSPVTLPLLNVQLPIVGFYVVVSWLLLLVYFNLLLHLTFLAQRLHRFNAVLAAFPDEVMREDQRLRLFPFPFSVMLIGRPTQWRLRRLLGLIVWTTVLLLPLVLVLWAQVRFLPYHHEGITWSHRAAVLVNLTLVWLFWPLIFTPAPGSTYGALTALPRQSLRFPRSSAALRSRSSEAPGQSSSRRSACATGAGSPRHGEPRARSGGGKGRLNFLYSPGERPHHVVVCRDLSES